MKNVREICTGRVERGSKIFKGFSLMLAISLIVIGCDSVVDQNVDVDESLSMSDTAEIYSMNLSQSECIDPDDPEYSEKAESKIVEWGNRRNPSTKTVDIVTYNTLDQFVLKVKSSHNIADVLVDDESIKNFNGTLSPDTWQEFTFELEEDWEAGDTWAFEVKIAGSGPPVYFDVDYQLVGECVCGPVTFMYGGDEVTYGTVIGANDRCWLDRNLGASRVAQSSTDSLAYGDLFQWGRAADGHQLRTSDITTEVSNTDTPGHGSFILAQDSPTDWRSPQNDNLWQGVNGINNPCPTGYRLPTSDEWESERQSWSSDNSVGAFASPLQLPLTGARHGALDWPLIVVGSSGYYWSSTVESNTFSGIGSSGRLSFNINNANSFSFSRGFGFSVRCILD